MADTQWWFVVLMGLLAGGAELPTAPTLTAVSLAEAAELQAEVVSLFDHAFSSYLVHAFPSDVLQPLSCSGRDQWKGISLTLIDSLDALAIIGNRTAFAHAVEHCVQHVRFDIDENVSVFETTIRALGGLLSAHVLAADPRLGLLDSPYPPPDGGRDLLTLATELGDRLLPAFETPTAIPYGTVNLRHGVPPAESTVACTAAAGSLTLEFSTLSRLTGDRRYHRAAARAARALWALRSRLDLVGAHVDVATGRWTQLDAGVGRGIDSFYEYMLKEHVLAANDGGADGGALARFRTAYHAIETHTKAGDAYVEVSMRSGELVWPIANSLQAFWPGVQALAGDVDAAARGARLFRAVRDRCSWLPEGFSLRSMRAEAGQRSHPLRPELAESLLHLHHATGGHPEWRLAGRDLVHALRALRVPCGVAAVADVRTGALSDSMESFALSETLKYLYFLFDEPADAEADAQGGGGRGGRVYEHGRYVFTTEGHVLPVVLPPLPARARGMAGGDEDDPPAAPLGGASVGSGGDARVVHWRGVCAMPTWRQRLGLFGGGPLEGGPGHAVAAAMGAAATAEAEEALRRSDDKLAREHAEGAGFEDGGEEGEDGGEEGEDGGEEGEDGGEEGEDGGEEGEEGGTEEGEGGKEEDESEAEVDSGGAHGEAGDDASADESATGIGSHRHAPSAEGGSDARPLDETQGARAEPAKQQLPPSAEASTAAIAEAVTSAITSAVAGSDPPTRTKRPPPTAAPSGLALALGEVGAGGQCSAQGGGDGQPQTGGEVDAQPATPGSRARAHGTSVASLIEMIREAIATSSSIGPRGALRRSPPGEAGETRGGAHALSLEPLTSTRTVTTDGRPLSTVFVAELEDGTVTATVRFGS